MGNNFFTGLPDDESTAQAQPDRVSDQTLSSLITGEKPKPTLGDRATDVARGLVGGTRDAIQGTINTVLTGAEMVSNASPLTTDANKDAVGQVYKDLRSKLTFSEVEQNTTGLGAAIRGITQFGMGFVTGGKVLKAVPGFAALGGAGVAGRVAQAAVQSGVGDAIVSDPHAERLSNLIESVPWLANPVTELLSAGPDDSEAMGKFKAGIEGAVAGALSESLIVALGKGIRATVQAVRLRAAGKAEAADAAIKGAAPEMEKALGEMASNPVDVAIHPNARGAAEMEAEALAKQHGLEYQGTWADGGPHEFKDVTRIDPKTGGVTNGNLTVNTLDELPKALSEFEKKWGIEAKAGNGAAPVNGAAAGAPDAPHTGAGAPGAAEVKPADVLREKTLTDAMVKEHFGVDASTAVSKKLITKVAEGEGYKVTETGVKYVEDSIRANEATAKVGDVVQTMQAQQAIEPIRWKRIAGQAPELEGALNYDKFSTGDDVKQFMSELVKRTKNELPDLLGSYQPQKETLELARIMGKDAGDLYTSLAALRLSNEDLAAHIVAGKNLIKKSVEDTYRMAEKINNGAGTEMDFVLLQHMSDVTLSVMDHVSSLQTAAARATAAGRIQITGGITRENYAKLLEQVGGYESVKNLAARLKMTEGDIPGLVSVLKGTPSVAEKVTAVHNFLWMNGVLSGLKTMVVNPVTTGFNSAVMPGFRMVGGLMQSVAGNEAGMNQFWQGVYQYKYFTAAFADSVSWARKSFAANGSLLDQASNPLGKVGYTNPLSAEYLAPDAAIPLGFKNILDWAGTLVGIPGRALTTQDEFFKQLTYRTHVLASAHVEGAQKGIEGQALKDFVNEKLAASLAQNGKALDESALGAAKYATFTQDLNNASWWNQHRTPIEALATFSNAHPLVKGTILPFVKVPSNLLRQAVDMTPLGFARKQVIEDIKAGGEAGAMALGKIGAGTAFWGSAIALAYNERITGAGPKDPDLRRQLGEDWKPYSFVLHNDDGTKSYISYERADPFGMFFGLAADFAEIHGHMSGGEQENWAMHAVTSMLHNLSSKTYLRGITDILDAMQGDDASLSKYLKSRAASYVPGIVQAFNPDVEIKDTRAGSTLTQMLSAVQARVPGWSNSLEARRDNFGEKVMPPMGYPFTAINPFTYYRGTDDPVRKELADLARTDSEAKFSLPNPILLGPKDQQVDLRLIKDPVTGQSAYDRWMELHQTSTIGGKTLHDAVADTVASPAYQKYREAMGNGDALFKDSFAVDLLRQKFDLYEQHTWLQVTKEFPGVAPAKLRYSIDKSLSRFKGPQAGTPIEQLREIAGQTK